MRFIDRLKARSRGRGFRGLRAPLAFDYLEERAVPASQIWSTTTTSTAWLTVGNWQGGAAPGSATVTTNTDVATFDNVSTSIGTGSIGLNFNTQNGTEFLGALSLTNGNAGQTITIGNSSTSKQGVFSLNGATIGTLDNVIISDMGNKNLKLTTVNTTSSTSTFTMAMKLGSTSSVIVVGPGLTTSILPAISELNAGSGLTLLGSGTLALSGANSYSGTTTISAGALILGGTGGTSTTSPLGSPAVGTIVSGTGAELDLAGVSIQAAEPLTLSGVGINNAGALLNSSATAATFPGPLSLGTDASIIANSGNIILSSSASIGGAGNLTLDGSAVGNTLASGIATGSGSLTKNGSGLWVLGGASTYTGSTTINAGTLIVNGSLASGSAVTMNGGVLGGTGTIAGAIAVASGTILPATAATTGTLTAGNLSFASGILNINMTASGADELVTESADITNATLSVNATGFSGVPGTVITILHSTGLTGKFANQADGSTVTSGGLTFQVGYTSTDVTLTVVGAPAFTSANSTTFQIGSANSFTFTSSGFPAATYSLAPGDTLPDGVSLTGAVLSGTPTSAATVTLHVTATNSVGSDMQTFTLTINGLPLFTSSPSATFTAGIANSFNVTVSGSPTPALSEDAGDVLPTGVSFSGGVLGGSPSADAGGIYTLHFTATSSAGTAHQVFTLTVNQTPAFTSANTTTFVTGSFGTFPVTASGFPTPTITENPSDVLPAGVTFAGGVLSGTPTVSGLFTLDFTASNASGSVPQTFTLEVDAPPAFTSTTATAFTLGSPGTFNVTASGTPTPVINEAATDTLPSGVTFDNGVLSGTPAPGTYGTWALHFTATNVNGAANQTFTLSVNQSTGSASWNTLSGTAWLTAGNWLPNVFPGAESVNPDNHDIATFGPGTYSLSGIGLNLSTAGGHFSLGTISASAPPILLNIGDSSTGVAGTLFLYGATLLSVPNVILSSTSANGKAVSLVPNTSAAIVTGAVMTVSLGNTANTIISGANSPIAIKSSITESNPGSGLLLVGDSTGSGSLALSGANSFTGSVSVSAGILQIGSSTALGTADAGTIISTGAELDLNGQSVTDGEALTIGGTGIASAGAIINSSATAATFSGPITLTGDTTLDASAGAIALTNNAPITLSGAATALNLNLTGAGTGSTLGASLQTGTGTVTMNGTGSWDLSGVNTYTGATTVNSGALLVDGSTAAGSAVNVVSGTLGGSGTINGPVTVASGTVNPGSATASGTLTVASLAIGSNALAFDMIDTANDELVVGGPLDISTVGFTLNASNYANPSGAPFSILHTTGLTGTFASAPAGTTLTASDGQMFLIQYSATDVTLTLVAPPTFSSTSTPTENVGTAFSLPITATGYPTPITVTEAGTDVLPAGVTFANGVLGGTPAVGTGGVYTLNFTASNGISPNTTQIVTLTVDEPVSFAASTAFLGAGVASTYTVKTVGYPLPTITDAGTDVLPAGVNFSNGTFSGTAQALSTTTLHLTADNGVSPAVTQTFTLSVDPTTIVTSFFDSAIYAVDARNGAVVATIAAPSDGSGAVSFPDGETIGPDGNLYVSNQGNGFIDEINLGTGVISQLVQTSFTLPTFVPAGLVFGPDDNLYVVSNGGQGSSSTGGVYRFDFTFSGGSLSYNGGLGTPIVTSTTQLPIFQPSGITFGTSASNATTLYFSNDNDGASGTVVEVPTATTTPGTATNFVTPGSGGLNSPAGLTFGPGGKLYVTDLAQGGVFQGQVLRYNTDGSFDESFALPVAALQGQFPSDAVFDDQGNLMVALLGTSQTPPFTGSVNEYNSTGAFVKTLVSSSQFAGGIVASELVFAEPAAFTSASAASFALGSAGSFTVSAIGSPAPVIAMISGTLPTGLTFSGGIISGTPAAGPGGSYPLTFTATNGIGAAVTQSFILDVTNGPKASVYVSSSSFGGAPAFGDPITDADPVMAGAQAATWGVNAFASINEGLAVLSSGGTLTISGGAYNESVTVPATDTLAISGAAGAGETVTINTIDSASTSTIKFEQTTLAVGDNDGLNHTIAGTIMGQGGLTKIGTDTLTLTGTTTYSGTTTASQGTLIVNSTLTTSAITVSPTGTLGGAGTVDAVTASGIVDPGASGTPGTLSTGTLTLHDASGNPGTLHIDIGSTSTFDKVASTGAIDITGASLALTVNAAGISPGNSFTILSGTSITGTFNGLPSTGSTITVGSQMFSVTYGANSVALSLVASATLVGSPVLNSGNAYINSSLATHQHSMVESVVYSFSSAVSLSASNFTLSGFQGTPPSQVPNVNVSGSGSVWTVTFSGNGVNAGTNSIGDGEYELVLSGVPGMASNTYDFFRLLGDMDGNGTVNTSDFATLISTFLRATNDPLYLGADDFDGDQTIGTTDFAQFTQNFLKSVPTPLPN